MPFDDSLLPLCDGARMALVLPCGDGALLAALRERGVPAVGADADADAVQRCRAQRLWAFAVPWPQLALQAPKFDRMLVDLRALRLPPPQLRPCLQLLVQGLLPGGVLLLPGAGAEVRAAATALGLEPAGDAPLALRRPHRPPAAMPEPRPLLVAPYADLLAGCRTVLEFGAGDGRFLDALHVRDVDAVGTEADAALAARAGARGRNVAAAGLEHALQRPGAFGGVSVGHAVQALAAAELPLLLAAARQALQPHGRLLLRARADAAVFAVLPPLATAHGFRYCRESGVPGDADDRLLLLLADAGPPPPPPPAAALATVRPSGRGQPLDREPQTPFDLERFERRVCSQGGEDGVLAAIFERIGTTDRSYVEFGCGDGVQCNTAHLRRQGWSGLLLDGQCAPGAPDADIVAAWITAENIQALFDAHGVPAAPDLMSIDLDGNDYQVWRAIDRRPRVVVAEYNANLGCDAALTIPYDPQHRWDGTDFYGASLPALDRLAQRKGYTLVYCNSAGVNAFFVRDDLLAAGLPRPPLAAVWRPPNYWYRGGRQVPDLQRRLLELG